MQTYSTGVLRIELPEESTIVGYADDIALVVVDNKLGLLEAKCNDAIARVQWWLNNAGLFFSVLISARKQKETIRIMIGEHEILSQDSIKHHGLTIDSGLSYKYHLLAVSNKVEKINGAVMRILPNSGGPQGERRRLISTVVDSVVLYAAPIWAEAKNCH